MPNSKSTLFGHCHCGRIRVHLSLAQPVSDIVLRRCGCDFCQRHGVRGFSDAGGNARIEAENENLIRYRFAHRTAEFLSCRTCSVHVAALVESDDVQRAVFNIAGIAPVVAATSEIVDVDFEGEASEARMRRRLDRWMPVVLVDGFGEPMGDS